MVQRPAEGYFYNLFQVVMVHVLGDFLNAIFGALVLATEAEMRATITSPLVFEPPSLDRSQCFHT